MAKVVNAPAAPGNWQSSVPTVEHPAAPDRYHLYVGWFCPFAHRVLLAREQKGLQDVLPLSVVKPYPKEGGGWRLNTPGNEYPDSTEDHLFGSAFLHEVYFRSPPNYKEYKGRYSVPVLWDKQAGAIVNNESEQLVRILSTGFNDCISDPDRKQLDFYPPDLRARIDEVNAWLVPEFNIGVYMAGHAPDQEKYEERCHMVFGALDRLESMLAEHGQRFLLGERMTELDFKAYTTLIRFDTVYVQHLKLNMKTIRHDYRHLHRYLKNLYWNVKGFRETTNFKHIKEGYFKSHADLNPSGIVPVGPTPDIESWTEEDQKWLAGLSQ